jgi:hypothetical protein
VRIAAVCHSGYPLADRKSRGQIKPSQSGCDTTKHQAMPPCFLQTQPHPFPHSVGCEVNRTRHPSRSSLSWCFTTALVALATPEKRWCQDVSKGLLHSTWLSLLRLQSLGGSRIGRFSAALKQMAQRQRPIIRSGWTPVRFPGSPSLAKL